MNNLRAINGFAANLAIAGTNTLFDDTIPPAYQWDLIALCSQVPTLASGNIRLRITDSQQSFDFYLGDGSTLQIPQFEDEMLGVVRSPIRLRGRVTITLTNNSAAALSSWAFTVLVRMIPVATREI